MVDAPLRALYQPFLPEDADRAFVWKYTPVFGGRRPRHFHSEPELNLIVSGTAKVAAGDRVIQVSEGELLAFPSGQDHALLESSPDFYLFAMGLDPVLSADVLKELGEAVVPLHVRLDAQDLAAVTKSATAIVDRKGNEQLAAELWQRVHWLGRRGAGRASRGVHVLTRRALQLLARSPHRALEDMAEDLQAHPSEISRHFHRDVGMTLVRYRVRLRLLQVIDLVDAGQHDLMTAAIAAGFGSYSQCHRAFHAELGCAPRHFFRSDQRRQMQLAYDALAATTPGAP